MCATRNAPSRKRNSLVCGRILDYTTKDFNADYTPDYAAVSYWNRKRHRHAGPKYCATVRFPGAVAAKAPQTQTWNDQCCYPGGLLTGIEHWSLAHAHNISAVKLLCFKGLDVVFGHLLGTGKIKIFSSNVNYAITPCWNGRLLKAAVVMGVTKANGTDSEATRGDVRHDTGTFENSVSRRNHCQCKSCRSMRQCLPCVPRTI